MVETSDEWERKKKRRRRMGRTADKTFKRARSTTDCGADPRTKLAKGLKWHQDIARSPRPADRRTLMQERHEWKCLPILSSSLRNACHEVASCLASLAMSFNEPSHGTVLCGTRAVQRLCAWQVVKEIGCPIARLPDMSVYGRVGGRRPPPWLCNAISGQQ